MSHPTVHPELQKIAESLRKSMASIGEKAQETTAAIVDFQLESLEWLTEDELEETPEDEALDLRTFADISDEETPSPRG